MQIEFDTLKQAKLLCTAGIEKSVAERIISTIAGINIRNIYAKNEVNDMLSETVEKAFRDGRKQFEELTANQRRFEKKFEEQFEKQFGKRFEQRLAGDQRRFEAQMARREVEHDRLCAETHAEFLALRNSMRNSVLGLATLIVALGALILHVHG